MTVSAEGRVKHQELNQTTAELDLLEKNLTTLPGFTFTPLEFLTNLVL